MSGYNIPTLQDKIICGLFYSAIFIPIVGWVPVIWLVVTNIKRIYVKDFFKYHCYQAVLLNMIAFALPQVVTVLVNFFMTFLSLFGIFDGSISLLGGLVKFSLGIYYVLIKVLAIYAIVWTMRGRYTNIPPLSQAVNMLLR